MSKRIHALSADIGALKTVLSSTVGRREIDTIFLKNNSTICVKHEGASIKEHPGIFMSHDKESLLLGMYPKETMRLNIFRKLLIAVVSESKKLKKT